MDDFCKAEYHIPNTDITIEFSRWKKPFSFIQSSQYECHIKFTNFTGQILIDIPCNEKYLVDLMQSLYDWDSFSGQYQFGILLNSISNNISYQIQLAVTDNFIMSPTEEEEYNLLIFESSVHGTVARLSTKVLYSDLVEIIDQIYMVLADIPYIEDLATSDIFLSYR